MNDLTGKAMQTKLTITTWTARKPDKKVSNDVAVAHSVSTQAGVYRKNLLPFDAPTYKAIGQALGDARTFHYANTLPWGDDESRILPSVNHPTYIDGMRIKRTQFTNAVSDFVNDAPALWANARKLLNGLWRADDYPDIDTLADKFTFKVKISPLASADDFRVQLSAIEMQAIKEDYAAEFTNATDSAMRALYGRVFEAVARMTERLSTTDAIFRDSLVGNVRELCDIVPRLNITNDSELESIRQSIERDLAEFEPDELRESKALRNDIARKAQAIQDRMASFMVQRP